MTTHGGCGCGEVRYERLSKGLFTHACHCMDCQNASGGAFLINMFVDLRDLRVGGRITSTNFPTASGAGREVFACAACGTQIWTRYHLAPANIGHLRTGTLDDTSGVRPAAHIFTRTMQPWMTIPSGAPTFEAMYDRPAIWPAESLERLAGIAADG